MKIVVCIRQGLDGDINPFDACAYEAALQIAGSEITLLSMGPEKTKDFLHQLTRRGAKNAVLLSDAAFAGADTLATAYALGLAIKKIKPDMVFCGRQTLVGDTAQTGPMLSVMCDYSLITGVMEIKQIDKNITCMTRTEGEITAALPALITVERINNLRLPSIRSKTGEIEVWSADDIGADKSKCGLAGSPTRVLKTYENSQGKRKCKFITLSELDGVIAIALAEQSKKLDIKSSGEHKLKKVVIIGENVREFADTVSDDICLLTNDDEQKIIDYIVNNKPNAVLWSSDARSKRMAAMVAARLGLGLCADCTALETDGEKLIMYRPALSGSIIAKIESLTKPAMATVRTKDSLNKDVFVAVGYGAKDNVEWVKALAKKYDAELSSTRKAVDNGIMPYATQVGLTGRSVAPPVYIAVGVSGAVHHIVGMQSSGTVIAINNDKNADIFDYADYGIIEDIGFRI